MRLQPPSIRLQSTEAIYIKELPALRALFECYADGGGGGRADLMSMSEFDLLLTHTRLYDAEFTRRANPNPEPLP